MGGPSRRRPSRPPGMRGLSRAVRRGKREEITKGAGYPRQVAHALCAKLLPRGPWAHNAPSPRAAPSRRPALTTFRAAPMAQSFDIPTNYPQSGSADRRDSAYSSGPAPWRCSRRRLFLGDHCHRGTAEGCGSSQRPAVASRRDPRGAVERDSGRNGLRFSTPRTG